MKALFLAVSLVAAPLCAYANGSCPAAVKAAVDNAHAGSKIRSCKQGKENGKIEYEVKLRTSDGRKLELDVAPEGAILLTEEKIALAAVPPAVSAAFAARYPAAQASAAEKQTKPDGKASYELVFKVKGKKTEATFDESGSFVSEE